MTKVAELDRRYAQALAALERLSVTWRQQPENLAALRTTAGGLKASLTTLHETATGRVPAQKATAQQAASGAARGPVEPSREPSTEEEMALRRKATEQWMSRDVPDKGEPPPTLAGVPVDRITSSCTEAERAVSDLLSLLGSEAEAETIEARLARIGELLDGLARRPQE